MFFLVKSYNTAVVVTRYFGGTLLGTGGLVRAYSKAVQEGLSVSRVIEKHHGVLVEIGTDYNGVGKLQYLFAQKEGTYIGQPVYRKCETADTGAGQRQGTDKKSCDRGHQREGLHHRNKRTLLCSF